MPDPNEHPQSEVIAVDQEPGGDADQPGIAQPISQDEISDLINNSQMPIEEREARLHAIAQRLGTRENIDLADEFDPMREQVNEALNMLASGGHSYGSLDAAGFDPDDRSDAQAPDDTGPSKV